MNTSISVVCVTDIATTVPDAPVIMSATAGTAEAVAAWTAPSNDGGSPVIRYSVRMVDAATGTKDIAVKDGAGVASNRPP